MSRSLKQWLALLEKRHPSEIELGLDRCSRVWHAMGSPRPARRIVTIAGTNGKGSTLAFIDAMLRSLGHTTGCYTSPHLLSYRERIRINDRLADRESLVTAFEKIDAVRNGISLTYFEFGTLAAFELMARAHLDFALLEVGLGGRLDAVNVLDTDCAVITPVGLDHQDYLGSDLEDIGREKAGILRAGKPFVCGDPVPPQSMIDAARRLQTPLKRIGQEFSIRVVNGRARFNSGEHDLNLPLPVLEGDHQLANMATAVSAVLELMPDAADREDELSAGLCSVNLPGRLQRLNEEPLIIVDVGHNPLAASVVANAIGSALKTRAGAEVHCVLGMLADKDAAAVAATLDGLVQHWYCAGLQGNRGQSGEALAGRMKLVNGERESKPEMFSDVRTALDCALQRCGRADILFVFGSFLTAAEAFRWWREGQSTPRQISGLC